MPFLNLLQSIYYTPIPHNSHPCASPVIMPNKFHLLFLTSLLTSIKFISAISWTFLFGACRCQRRPKTRLRHWNPSDFLEAFTFGQHLCFSLWQLSPHLFRTFCVHKAYIVKSCCSAVKSCLDAAMFREPRCFFAFMTNITRIESLSLI